MSGFVLAWYEIDLFVGDHVIGCVRAKQWRAHSANLHTHSFTVALVCSSFPVDAHFDFPVDAHFYFPCRCI